MSARCRSIEVRFWSFVDKSGGPDACWPWTGTRPSGYGVIYSSEHGNNVRATFLSCVFHGKPVGRYDVVRHTCNNPPCVNPAHLEPGTVLENTLDRVRAGRSACGPRVASARLDWDDVAKIREEWADGEAPWLLAARFDVSVSTVRKIVSWKTWRKARGPSERTAEGDARAAARRARGAGVGTSKLTEAAALDIFTRARSGEESSRSIAYDHGVSRRLVQFIRDGRAWAHLGKLPAPPSDAAEPEGVDAAEISFPPEAA